MKIKQEHIDHIKHAITQDSTAPCLAEYTLDKAQYGYDVRWSGTFERTIGAIEELSDNRYEAYNNLKFLGIYSSRDGAMCAVVADFERVN